MTTSWLGKNTERSDTSIFSIISVICLIKLKYIKTFFLNAEHERTDELKAKTETENNESTVVDHMVKCHVIKTNVSNTKSRNQLKYAIL